MKVIQVRNVNQALPEGLRHLEYFGRKTTSRNGDVLVSPTPVMTVYEQPLEKVLFWAERDANPFFQLMEALWMLAGRADVGWISYFNSNMTKYSDNGEVFHGAYGHRWRHHFGVDQLRGVVSLLRNHPQSRRAVISMWDPQADLQEGEKCRDIPCNTTIYVNLNPTGELDLTVTCRSNDIIWGAYGTNAVHFSMLLEYLAANLNVKPGRLYQLSNNFHAYVDVFEKNRPLIDRAADPYSPNKSVCPYIKGAVEARPLVANPQTFDRELAICLGGVLDYNFLNPFLRSSALLVRAYCHYKSPNQERHALDCLSQADFAFGSTSNLQWDWVVACREWLQRRQKGREVTRGSKTA